MTQSELEVDSHSVEKVFFRRMQENCAQTCALQVFLSKLRLKTSDQTFFCDTTKHTWLIKFCQQVSSIFTISLGVFCINLLD